MDDERIVACLSNLIDRIEKLTVAVEEFRAEVRELAKEAAK